LQKVNCIFIIKQKYKKHYEGRDEGEAHGVGTFFNCLAQQLAPRHCIINGNQNPTRARGRKPLTTPPSIGQNQTRTCFFTYQQPFEISNV
jgi:hypothetical protein